MPSMWRLFTRGINKMKYTLYIDESGDFQSPKVQWVISGVLFADTYENCEKFLNIAILNQTTTKIR